MRRVMHGKKMTLILAPVALAAGAMVWEGCSGSESAAPSGPASKAVAGGFQADTSTDYDPFKGMSESERKDAIGSADTALDYLKVAATQLVKAINDPTSRKILSENVPAWEKGEVKLADIAIDNPTLLTALSSGVRASVGSLSGTLASEIQGTASDGEALLKMTEALFDLEVTLVTPPGEEWDPSEEIAVHFVPIDNEATSIEGLDADGSVISLSADATEASYAFLAINFDEDGLSSDSQTVYQTPLPARSIWNFSLISAAYADYPDNHAGCYHENMLQPAKEITIYNDHETGWFNDPEIMIEVKWNGPDPKPWSVDYSLEDVDEEDRLYTSYAWRLTDHGRCSYTNKLRVYEDDFYSDDTLAYWNIAITGQRTLNATNEVKLVVDVTDQDS
ncbi:MAG: hypothetical protein OXG13_13830 [Gemmatimonadaceae bacterium]|nr:hypothetical protein [Gemmatimonadaceae bacterium]